jgi:putative sterol carrier protein
MTRQWSKASGQRQATHNFQDVQKEFGMVNRVEEIIGFMQSNFIPGNASGVDAVFQLELSGDRTCFYYVVVKNGECQIKEGVHSRPTVTIDVSLTDLVDIMKGKIGAPAAFFSGKMRVSGDLMLARLFHGFFKPITTEDA